jgi:hypothetical protein
MARIYDFGDINTLNGAQIESAFLRASKDIGDVFDEIEDNESSFLEERSSIQLKDLEGYYEDFINRLEELNERYHEIQNVRVNPHYLIAQRCGNRILYKIGEKKREKTN